MDDKFREVLIQELTAQHSYKNVDKDVLLYNKNTENTSLVEVKFLNNQYIIGLNTKSTLKNGGVEGLIGWLQSYPETKVVGYYGYIVEHGQRFYGKFGYDVDVLVGVVCFTKQIWEEYGCPENVTRLCEIARAKKQIYCLNIDFLLLT